MLLLFLAVSRFRSFPIGVFLNMDDINFDSDLTHTITDTDYSEEPYFVIQNIRFSLLDALRFIKDTYEQYKNVQQINLIGNRWKNDPPRVKELIDKLKNEAKVIS